MNIKTIALIFSLAFPAFSAPQSPSPVLNWTLAPKDIETQCAKIKKDVEAALKTIEAVPAKKRSFENTVWAFEDLGVRPEDVDPVAGISFLKNVSPDKAVRDAANTCESDIKSFSVDVYTREKLYGAFRDYADKKEKLDAEEQKLLDRILFEFQRNGLALDAKKRGQVKELKQRLITIQQEFDRNLNEYKDFLDVTRQELDGLPEDYIAKLSTAPEGKYRVTLQYPDYIPFMENAKNEAPRKALEFKFNNRAAEKNTPLLEQAIALRHQIANLMGHPTHAHFVLTDRMAKKPEAVSEFLTALRPKLTQKALPELETLKALKKKEGREGADKINAWEFAYYDNLLKKTQYDLDDQKIKEYFPMERTLEGMMKLYQGLLSVRFVKIDPPYVWHPEVTQYEVRDEASGDRIGYFYLDLFPREGKYGHAAAFGLVPGRRMKDGSYQYPVAAMVANFNKPGAGLPSLLQHSEVETLFHEFGHVMHQVLTQARYARFSGTAVAWDFVEAPSQMFENWVWNAGVLRDLSSHYKDGKPLPEDLLKRMVDAKNLNSGLRYLRQVFYATVDQTYHTREAADSTSLYNDLRTQISLIPATAGTRGQASFGHLMHGYDSGYYGYLWSEVFAADMFSFFEKNGLLNKEMGMRYRKLILEAGSMRDEAESLRNFLGRAPEQNAFIKSIGLK